MEKCKKCDTVIQQPKDGVKCIDCSANFHVLCVSTTGKVSTRKSGWKCDGCALETLSAGSRSSGKDGDSAQGGVLEAIAAFRKEFNERSDQTLVKLNTVQDDIKRVVAEVSVLKSEIADIKVKHENTSESVENLKLQNGRLSRELESLKSEVADMQQHSRKNNILISGVPLTRGENVYAVLEQIAKVLNVVHNLHNISVAHRLPSGDRDARRPPSIVVSFVARITKQEWMDARRRRRTLSAREVHASFPDTPVFFNEHLTVQNREIFNGARRLVKAGRLAAVWTSDCRVLAKGDVSAPPFRVRDMQHLRHLGLDSEGVNGGEGTDNATHK